MKILSLGLDQNILNPAKSVYKRVSLYAREVESYTVIIPSQSRKMSQDGNFVTLGSGGLFKIWQLFNMFWRSIQVIRSKKIDVITSQDIYFVGLLAIWLGKIFKIGVEIQVHGLEKFDIIRREIVEIVLNHADSIRVVGHDLRKYLINYFSLPAKKFVTTPVFVDWKRIRYAEFDYTISQAKKDHFIFLVVARLVSVKNIDGIIRAFVQVNKEYKKTQLIIVGDGPLRTKLMGIVRELGIEDNVHFAGWVDSVTEYYRASDCGVFFSKSEGYGVALIEALACQLPVISTNVGIASEVVQDGKNGLLIDVDDVESLERLMKLVVINRDMLETMKKNTRVCLEQLPTLEEVILAYKQSWRNVAQVTLKKKNRS